MRGSLLVSSRSALGFKLSTIHLRYQPLRSWTGFGGVAGVPTNAYFTENNANVYVSE
jgi:hypothetical protein